STSQGFLFALRDQGEGPYRLESPSGAFPGVQLSANAGLAWALVRIGAPDGVEYRFLTGAGAPFSDPLSRNFSYADAATLSFVSLAGAHLERWPGIGDAKLPPRTLRILVPAQRPTGTMFVQDGQNLFGPSPFGGWGLQQAAGPSTLVVGIDNTRDRIAEYTAVQDVITSQTLGGKGLDYADFVELTVRPFVEARYGKTARAGVMGSSLGGLISYVIKRRYPSSYEFVASLSGTFGWGSIGPGVHNLTEIQAWAAMGACPTGTFYVDSGGGPGSGCVDSDADGIQDDTPNAADNYCENAQMRDVLLALGCGARTSYVFSSGSPHSEPAWRGRAPAIFRLFERSGP
ncbi:MAG TPA: alpha/beta hydrolase-fold protein, partial [Myxococcaceae bacterium]|nr:alpha/beta hydrolase-fold protein [Myxococcaceae bacterium]